jgi:penicillin-binding protein activator
MRLRLLALCALLVVDLAGCPPRPRPFANLPPPAPDPPPCWDAADADLVVRQTIDDLLAAPWLSRFHARQGRAPVLRLLAPRNRSVEPINGAVLLAKIASALLRSGRVRLVGGTAETRTERSDQARHASDDTAKEHRELGSDFVLSGWIDSTDSDEGGRRRRAFLTTLELTDIRTNEKPWMKVHRLRKLLVLP